jgi:hypothetical protein
MFQKRWYDMNPTLSVAVSLLHNTLPEYRAHVTAHIQTCLQQQYPHAYARIRKNASSVWRFLPQRQTMDPISWEMIENLRILEDKERQHLALEIIQFIYCLENKDSLDAMMDPNRTFEAAL